MSLKRICTKSIKYIFLPSKPVEFDTSTTGEVYFFCKTSSYLNRRHKSEKPIEKKGD